MRAIRSLSFGTYVRLLGVLVLIGFVILYVHFQARNLLQGPLIELTSEYVPLQHERNVGITGKAHNIVKLTLNGREIHTDESGAFTQTLVLPNGYTIMELSAQDRFGRTTSILRKYVYVPSEV